MAPPTLVNLQLSELIARAEVDPWDLEEQLATGRPDQIDDLANNFHKASGHVGEGDLVFAQARKHLHNSYQARDGVDTIGDATEVRSATQQFQLSAESLKKISSSLEEIAVSLADCQNAAQHPISSVNSALASFDSQAGAAGLTQDDYTAIVLQAAAAVASAGSKVKSIHKIYEGVLNSQLTAIESTGYIPGIKLSDAAPTVTLPEPGATATDVKKWWDSLSPAQQQMAIASRPDLIGNLNGVPVVDRSAANHVSMKHDRELVDQAAAKFGVPADVVAAHPENYGLPSNAGTRYTNAGNVAKAVSTDSKEKAPVYVMAYEPTAFDGKGALPDSECMEVFGQLAGVDE